MSWFKFSTYNKSLVLTDDGLDFKCKIRSGSYNPKLKKLQEQLKAKIEAALNEYEAMADKVNDE